MDIQEVEWEDTNLTVLALDRDRWRVVNAVINLPVPKTARNFLTS
jgi:hypothetical protein